jgi:tetratricopeptide (TPR) repeat protein
MSPEQASGDARIDARTDVYSLACVVYEMLGGEPPHTGPTPQAILARQLSDEVRSLRPVRTSVNAELDAVVKRALSPAPADRYETVAEFVQALTTAAAAGPAPAGAQAVPHRRPLRVALVSAAAAVGVVGACLVLWNLGLVPKAAAGERPVTLAVFPFSSVGPEAGNLGEGVADLLTAAIDGTVGMVVSDPTGLWRPLRRGRGDPLHIPDLEQAKELAHRVSAPAWLLGSVTAVGGQLDINARLYDDAGLLKATLTSAAPAESLSDAVNRLAIDVVTELWQRDTLPTVPVIENLATESMDALRAYLEAKRLKRLGRFEEAEASLQHAVTLDSTFALAQMELFEVRSMVLFLNAQPFVGLTEIIDRAMRYRDKLTPRNRLRVEAAKAMDETDGLLAATLYERILAIDSLDVDALHGLAFAYLRDGWQMGKGTDAITAAYDRVVRVDPTSVPARLNRAWLALPFNDWDVVDRELAQLRPLDTLTVLARGRLGAYQALRSSPSERDTILRRLASEPVPVVLTVLRDLRATRPALAERYMEELITDSMPVAHQRVGVGARAQLWLAEGRPSSVDSLIQTGELREEIRSVLNRFVIASALAGVGEANVTARAAAELEAFAPAESLAAYLDTKSEVWATGWAVGAFHATLGDTTAARIWQRALAALPRGDTPWDWTASLAADIEARLAVRRGDADAAKRAAQRAYDAWLIHSGYVGEADPEPAMRFHLAEILRATGDIERAAALHRSLVPPHTWIGFYTARAAFEVGEIARSRGDRVEAARYYRIAEQLWELGEPDVVGVWLERVRDAQRQLGVR